MKVRGKDAEGKDITIEETKANLEVRIGAILSLERIAQDSTRYDKGRDHVRVMEILCAYMRENAPARTAQDHAFGKWEPLKDDPTDEERAAHLEKREARFDSIWFKSQVYQWAQSLPEPRSDIAIALQVIGRRSTAQRLAEARWGKDAGENDRWVFDTSCPSLPDETTPETRAGFAAELENWKETIGGYKGYTLALSSARLHGARMEGADLNGARFDASIDWTDALLRAASVPSVDFAHTPISADQVESTFGDGSTKLPDTIPRPDHWPEAELDGPIFYSELRKWRAEPEGYKPPDRCPVGPSGRFAPWPPRRGRLVTQGRWR